MKLLKASLILLLHHEQEKMLICFPQIITKQYLSSNNVRVSFISGMSSALTVMLIAVSLCPDKNTTEPEKGPISLIVTVFRSGPEGTRRQNTVA